MKITYVFMFVIFAGLFSCNKTSSKKEIQVVQDTLKMGKIKARYTEIELNSKSKKAVENWMEYQKMDEFIVQYHNISLTDAIFNSNELTELAQQMKDSIRVEKFKTPSVKIRLNVLHNETLRLADMATIPKISALEVQKENENILNAYSALNLKINNIINQEKLNEELSDFIEKASTETNKSQNDETTIKLIQPKSYVIKNADSIPK